MKEDFLEIEIPNKLERKGKNNENILGKNIFHSSASQLDRW